MAIILPSDDKAIEDEYAAHLKLLREVDEAYERLRARRSDPCPAPLGTRLADAGLINAGLAEAIYEVDDDTTVTGWIELHELRNRHLVRIEELMATTTPFVRRVVASALAAIEDTVVDGPASVRVDLLRQATSALLAGAAASRKAGDTELADLLDQFANGVTLATRRLDGLPDERTQVSGCLAPVGRPVTVQPRLAQAPPASRVSRAA